MSHNCPHCGKPVNPAQMLGNVKSPKKEAAAKANGERLRRMYANARKLEGGTFTEEEKAHVRNGGRMTVAEGGVILDPRGVSAFDAPIPPKPTTLEGKKAAAMAALTSDFVKKPSIETLRQIEVARHEMELHDVPCAPFDIAGDEGTMRVTQMGKRLGLFYLGGGEPTFTRYLQEGELEKLWEARIK